MNTPVNYTPTEADRKFAEASIERTRLQSAAYLPQLLDALVEKALHPTATAKNILDAADFTYKASGLAKRQEEQAAKGPSFQVRIILPGQNREITIGGDTSADTNTQSSAPKSDDILDAIPANLLANVKSDNTDDLVFDVTEFDDE
jgi:hypothetical protein